MFVEEEFKRRLPAASHAAIVPMMNTTASRVLEQVKSLPEADQKAIGAALAKLEGNRSMGPRRKLLRLADGSYLNPMGIPNEDPIFTVLEEIEEQRHCTPPPDEPKFC